MRKNDHRYTTIQVTKNLNKYIREFCKKHKVNSSTITEMMWMNYISSSAYIKEVMVLGDDAKANLIAASSSGSISI